MMQSMFDCIISLMTSWAEPDALPAIESAERSRVRDIFCINGRFLIIFYKGSKILDRSQIYTFRRLSVVKFS